MQKNIGSHYNSLKMTKIQQLTTKGREPAESLSQKLDHSVTLQQNNLTCIYPSTNLTQQPNCKIRKQKHGTKKIPRSDEREKNQNLTEIKPKSLGFFKTKEQRFQVFTIPFEL